MYIKSTISLVVALTAVVAANSAAFARVSVPVSLPPVTPPSTFNAPGAKGGNVHSNLTCIGQFGGRILGGHICPLK
jgi:hypothetical protein